MDGVIEEKRVEKIEWLHQSFVTEWPELQSLISSLEPQSPESVFIRSQIILEKYQEQATLLDNHMSSIIQVITEKIIAVTNVPVFMKFFEEPVTKEENTVIFIQKCFTLLYVLCRVRGYKAILKYFPHEVARLEELELLIRLFGTASIAQLNQENSHTTELAADASFSTVTTTSATGKVNHFASNSTFSTESWHVEYVGSLWLSVAILAPFHLEVIDSSLGLQSIGTRIIDWCKTGIVFRFRENSPTLISSSLLLGKLLGRPDMQKELFEFVQWSLQFLERPTNNLFIVEETQNENSVSASQKTNVIITLSAILKICNRKGIFHSLLQCLIITNQAQQELLKNSAELIHLVEIASEIAQKGGTLQRKSVMKLCGRIGTTFLAPRGQQNWHYHRVTNSLLSTLQSNETSQSTEKLNNQDEFELDDETAEQIEQIVGILLQGIKDVDTKVRWSSARRLSYLAARLPQAFADQLIEFILELFSPLEEDGAWHGGCLALAEMSRKGVLIIERLADAIEAVKKAFLYDLRRGSSSRGSHVRDAACYVAWAFARTFNPETLEPYIQQLAECLTTMCLFDREVNCRRAAAAAFQEIVGRQGGPGCSNMPHGIEIVTTADYFSLGNRKDSYLTIATQITPFPEYKTILLDHLLQHKCHHWDQHIRKLAAQCLGRNATIAPEFLTEVALPRLLEDCTSSRLHNRHGSILGVAEIIRALSAAKVETPQEIQLEILRTIQTIEEKRLFRGRGGEMIREAVCHLIESVAYSRFRLPASLSSADTENDSKPFKRKPKSVKVLLQEMINENLKNPNEEIQFAAARCVRQFSLKYHSTRTPGLCKSLNGVIEFYMKHILSDPNPAARRGYALALGALSPSVLQLRLDDIISTLITSTEISKDKEMRDAETRRNSLEALMEICEKLKRIDGAISHELYQKIFAGMIRALGDYSVDNRGDVGSWIRESAIKCLCNFTFLLVRQEQSNPEAGKLFSDENANILICGLLKQAVEKTDRVRLVAGSILMFLLYSDNPKIMEKSKASTVLRSRQKIVWEQVNCSSTDQKSISWSPVTITNIPHHEALREAVDSNVLFYFTNGIEVFARLVPLMRFSLFRISLLTGICSTVGGLSKYVADQSSKALIDYAAELDNGELELFSKNLITIGKENENQEHMVVPFLRTIHVLLSNQILESLQPPENEFSYELVLLIRNYIRSTNDIRKLMEIVQVTVGLLPYNNPTRAITFKCLLALLSHRYPKIRQLCAEQFYVGAITYESAFSSILQSAHENILEILSTTAWEKEDTTTATAQAKKISSFLKQNK